MRSGDGQMKVNCVSHIIKKGGPSANDIASTMGAAGAAVHRTQ